jgi:cytochrome o ubiquinol oxidase operon protein cyoD
MTESNATHDAAQHQAHGHDGDHQGHAPFTVKGYAIGFIASVVLTAIPFWLVMAGVFESSMATALTVLGFAAVQIVVHMVYFLHLDPKSEGGWNMLAFIFTVVIVVIALSGSLWVMHHLNANMMPMPHDMQGME